jgi:hypothetical protein
LGQGAGAADEEGRGGEAVGDKAGEGVGCGFGFGEGLARMGLGLTTAAEREYGCGEETATIGKTERGGKASKGEVCC